MRLTCPSSFFHPRFPTDQTDQPCRFLSPSCPLHIIIYIEERKQERNGEERTSDNERSLCKLLTHRGFQERAMRLELTTFTLAT